MHVHVIILVTIVMTDCSLAAYKDKLKSIYKTPPTTWLSKLPNCKHIKLAMTKEQGIRYTREPDELIKHRVKGEVESLMDDKVLVDMDSIFDEGTFENVCLPLVILVEGALGSGKTQLAYHYCQKWVQSGKLNEFVLVVLVYLRHPTVRSAGMGLTLHDLLLFASNVKEDTDGIAKHVAQLVKDGLKCLLILDGWDEGPDCLRAPPDPKIPIDNSILGNLIRSVSSNTTILITSRPDSSVDLHNRPNMKRVEILGFTKESIHNYFREALSTQLPSYMILEDECRKLREYLANYPAIESSCYIPLNAAIFTHLYVKQTQPTTHFEMFYKIILLSISREVHTSRKLSSFDVLSYNHKKQLKLISLLAYEGVMNNKIVFTLDELPFILPRGKWNTMLIFLSRVLPGSSVMGVLHRDQTNSETISYNFSHLLVQEMLAAYHISKMRYFKQVRVFQTLLAEPRFSAVLQFYAGFTKLNNKGVRNIITGSDFDSCSKISLFRCFYEAQIRDQSLFTKIVRKLNGNLSLSNVTLSPLDHVSVRYFLAFAKNSGELINVNFTNCSIDDNSISLMMGELSGHVDVCPAFALHRVTELNISINKIGDHGIAYIATALQMNTCTLRKLDISKCGITDEGVESLAKALVVNSSLQELNVRENEIGDNGIDHIANTSLQTDTCSIKVLNISQCSISDEGAKSLAKALAVNRSLQELNISANKIHDIGLTRIATALRRNSTMTKLNISQCSISDEGAESLAANACSLQVLNISYNMIGSNGIFCIVTALQTITTTKTLYISPSDEQFDSLKKIADIKKKSSLLQIVDQKTVCGNGIAHSATAHILFRQLPSACGEQ